MILAMAVMMPLVMACGGDNDEPNGPNGEGGGGSGSGGNEKPDTSLFAPRNGIADGDNTIFLAGGKTIAANTNFTKDEMEKALSTVAWKRQYYIVYDHKYVSKKDNLINDNRNQIPIYLEGGKSWFYEKDVFDVPRKYTIKGRGFVMDIDQLSSQTEVPTTYTIVALDISDDTTRMVTDCKFPWYYQAPKGLKKDSTRVRIVWGKDPSKYSAAKP